MRSGGGGGDDDDGDGGGGDDDDDDDDRTRPAPNRPEQEAGWWAKGVRPAVCNPTVFTGDDDDDDDFIVFHGGGAAAATECVCVTHRNEREKKSHSGRQ